jgi:2-dehydro-3-deoxyphosphogluconate aldolase/(4S)-4-hydroxy-2-oxoglutarate aldolase
MIMPRFTKHETLGRMLDGGIIPIFYQKDVGIAQKIVEACVEGGAKIVEFTNRGDFAYQVFTELSKWCNENLPQITLGVGSVVDPATAALYINAGANFVVSPILNPEVAKVCNRQDFSGGRNGWP